MHRFVLVALLFAACAGPGARDPAAIAQAYLEAERYDEAVREIELAVRQAPNDMALRLSAAEVLGAAGRIDLAIAHLEMALTAAPREPEYSIRLGQLEQRRENPTDAYIAFRRAVELAPDDVRAVSGLALSAEALGFDVEASLAYGRWEELSAGAPAAVAE